MNASPPYSLPTFEAEEHPCPFCEDDAMFSVRHAHHTKSYIAQRKSKLTAAVLERIVQCLLPQYERNGEL